MIEHFSNGNPEKTDVEGKELVALPRNALVTGFRFPVDFEKLGTLIDCIGMFGSAGASTWRKRIFLRVLKEKGIDMSKAFNPQFDKPGEWEQNAVENAEKEAYHLNHDKVLAMGITPESAGRSGYASKLEAGMAAITVILTGQKFGMYLGKTSSTDEFDPAVRARRELELRISDIEKTFPGLKNIIEFFLEGDEEAGITQLAEWAVDQLLNGTTDRVELPEVSHMLVQNVLLTGTSGDTFDPPKTRKKLTEQLAGLNVPYFDTFVPKNVDGTESYGPQEALKEAVHKSQSAVILHSITNEAPSLGAIAETGWLITEAYIKGQAIGVYFDEKEYVGDDATAEKYKGKEDEYKTLIADANRARKSLSALLKAFSERFPGLVYVADSPEALVEFGQSQLESMRKNTKAPNTLLERFRKSRTRLPEAFVQGTPVPEGVKRGDVPTEFVPWSVAYPEYDPLILMTGNDVDTTPAGMLGAGEKPKWANEWTGFFAQDPEVLADIKKRVEIGNKMHDLYREGREAEIKETFTSDEIKVAIVSFTSKLEIQPDGGVHFPYGRTGVHGTMLGKFGPNLAADSIILRKVGTEAVDADDSKVDRKEIKGKKWARITPDLLNSLYASHGELVRLALSSDPALMNESMEVLLIQRSDGQWGIPGGMVDPGESTSAAAKRELEEETGEKDTDMSKGRVVYRGVVDDERNGDLSWMETEARVLVIKSKDIV